MKFSSNIVLFFIASSLVLPIRSIDLSEDKISAAYKDGGKNKINFSTTYMNADGSDCTPCELFPGTYLKHLFGSEAKSVCIDCSKVDDTCNQMKIVASFEKSWSM